MPTNPTLFIGSSSEGLPVANHLQSILDRDGVDATVWNQGVFTASTYTIPSLEDAARNADFAVLVATADDLTIKRGLTEISVRDNVLFELGLFIGAIGLNRVFVLVDATSNVRLPSDFDGLTVVHYRPRANSNNWAAVLGPAALGIRGAMDKIGRLSPTESSKAPATRLSPAAAVTDADQLEHELDRLCASATSQGWRVKTRSTTTLHLVSPKGKTFTMQLTSPAVSRVELRTLVADVRGSGMRVDAGLRRLPS